MNVNISPQDARTLLSRIEHANGYMGGGKPENDNKIGAYVRMIAALKEALEAEELK